MVAVLEAASLSDKLQYEDQIARSSPSEWLNNLPAMMWKVIHQPSGIALMEIMLASRADPELTARLQEMQTSIYDRARSLS